MKVIFHKPIPAAQWLSHISLNGQPTWLPQSQKSGFSNRLVTMFLLEVKCRWMTALATLVQTTKTQI